MAKHNGLQLGEVLQGEHAGTPMAFSLDLVRSGRLLLQASSGGGKSETIRKIATLTIPHIPNWIVDPEGEYAPLRAQLPFLLVGPGGEVPATLDTVDEVVKLLLETGVSAIFDLFEMGTAKYEYARRLFTALDEAPKKLWRDLLLTIDEAHMLAPQDVSLKRASSEAFANLASRGRKRGVAIVVATQRLALLNNDVAALCENMLFGRTGLLDQKRTATMLGYTGAAARDFAHQIGRVNDGDFYAYGRAFGMLDITLFHVERVPGQTLSKATRNKQRTAPPTPESIRKLLPRFDALPQEVAAKAKTEADLRKDLADALKKITALERAAAKPQLVQALQKVLTPQIDKEKLRMLTKKLEALGGGLAEAMQMANDQEQKDVRIRQLVEELGKLLGSSPALGRALKRAKDAQGEALAILPALVPSTVMSAAVQKPERGNVQASDSADPVPPEVTPEGLSGPEGKVLNAAAWLKAIGIDEPTSDQVAWVANYSVNASSFKNPRASLLRQGLIGYPTPGVIRLTAEGSSKAARYDINGSNGDVQSAVIARLSGPEAKLLRALIEVYPEEISANDLAARTNYSVSASSFKNPRATLKMLGFAEYPAQGAIRATGVLFPDGV